MDRIKGEHHSIEKWARILLLVICDAVCVEIAAVFATFLRFGFNFSAMQTNDAIHVFDPCGIFAVLVSLAGFFYMRLYSSIWEFAGDKELLYIAVGSVLSATFWKVSSVAFHAFLPRSFPAIYALVIFTLIAGCRFSYRFGRRIKHHLEMKAKEGEPKRTMIIGAGAGGSMAIKEFADSVNSGNKVVCVIDDDTRKHGKWIRGAKIIGGRDMIEEAVKQYAVEEIIFCIPSAPSRIAKEILDICSRTGAHLKTLPALSQLANGEVSVRQIRDISIEDLLGREVIHQDSAKVKEDVKGKTVLVTGGGGSIGSELCRQLAAMQPGLLVIFDIYENNAYEIQQELKRKYPELPLKVLIGSVREVNRVRDLFLSYHPDIVCHAAAHKHVPLMEDSPKEAIKNNVFGTYNVAAAAAEYGSDKFILISTDKAVNPANVMGATKRLCEIIVQSFNKVDGKCRFCAVRFGNVLGSNGSVIPLFRKQIAAGGPLTVTDKRITRFFMTIPEAVSLVLQAGILAEGGEVFVLDMGQPVRIDDMARNMIRLCGLTPDVDIKIEYTGLRPGEKLYEELLLNSEGLEKTENELIYVGHQRVYNEEEVNGLMNRLSDVLKESDEAVRPCVMELIRDSEPGTDSKND